MIPLHHVPLVVPGAGSHVQPLWWLTRWSCHQRSEGQDGATPRGFEPLRAEPNGFRVHLLNRSDTVSCLTRAAACTRVWSHEPIWRSTNAGTCTCRDPGSNRGPSDLQSDALPTELSRQLHGRCTKVIICHFTHVPRHVKRLVSCLLAHVFKTNVSPFLYSLHGASWMCNGSAFLLKI